MEFNWLQGPFSGREGDESSVQKDASSPPPAVASSSSCPNPNSPRPTSPRSSALVASSSSAPAVVPVSVSTSPPGVATVAAAALANPEVGSALASPVQGPAVAEAVADAAVEMLPAERRRSPRRNPPADAVPPAPIDRNQAVSFQSLRRSFPAPVEFDDIHIDDRANRVAVLCGRAPWFDYPAVMSPDRAAMAAYAQDGFLPGQVPLTALASWSWRHHFCVRDADLRDGSGRTLGGRREDWARAANGGICRLFITPAIPVGLNMDLFMYRTAGEEGYVAALAALPADLVESWRGVTRVDQRAICYGRARLRVEFRFLQKDGHYWGECVRGERRDRTTTGLAIPYQCPQHRLMTASARARVFATLTAGWT